MYNNVVETRKFQRHNGFDIDNHINKNTQDINTELRLPETLQIVIEPLTAIGTAYQRQYSTRKSL